MWKEREREWGQELGRRRTCLVLGLSLRPASDSHACLCCFSPPEEAFESSAGSSPCSFREELAPALAPLPRRSILLAQGSKKLTEGTHIHSHSRTVLPETHPHTFRCFFTHTHTHKPTGLSRLQAHPVISPPQPVSVYSFYQIQYTHSSHSNSL